MFKIPTQILAILTSISLPTGGFWDKIPSLNGRDYIFGSCALYFFYRIYQQQKAFAGFLIQHEEISKKVFEHETDLKNANAESLRISNNLSDVTKMVTLHGPQLRTHTDLFKAIATTIGTTESDLKDIKTEISNLKILAIPKTPSTTLTTTDSPSTYQVESKNTQPFQGSNVPSFEFAFRYNASNFFPRIPINQQSKNYPYTGYSFPQTSINKQPDRCSSLVSTGSNPVLTKSD